MYWLSFVDPDRPKGSKFLGAVIAPFDDFAEALAWTRMNHINPGGECKGIQFERSQLPNMTDDMIGRLLSKEFCITQMSGVPWQ